MKNMSLCKMIRVRPAGRESACGKNLNVAIMSFTIHTTFSDLDCISRSQQCQTVSSQNFMFLSDEVESLYDCWFHQVDHEYIMILDFRTCSRDIIGIFPHVKITFNIAFFSDTIKKTSFKLCLIITLLGVYIVIPGLMTLTLFQDHRCVRNINCKLRVLDSCAV